MSVDLGNPISSGRTAEIYHWDSDYVLKLFYAWVGLESSENEAQISHAIYESGLPVPEVGEIVRVNNRNGVIYQRITGPSMFRLGQHKPWDFPATCARRYWLRSQRCRMGTSCVTAILGPETS